MNFPGITAFPYFGETLALISALCWAIAVILFKTVGSRLGPVALNTFKNTLAFVLIPPTMLLLGQPLFRDAPAIDYGLLILSGVLGMGLSDTFYLMALNKIGAAAWSIVNTLYAPVVVILAAIYLGESLTAWQIAGVGLVVIALMLVGSEKKRNRKRLPSELTRTDWLIGFGYAFIGMISMAVSIVIVKPVLERSPLLWANEIRLGGGLLFLAFVIFARRRPFAIFKPLKDPFVAKRMFPAAFIGTYVTLILMLGSIKYALASVATVLNQLSNLFIFVLAVLFLSEPVNARRIIGLILGLTGAALVMFFRGG